MENEEKKEENNQQQNFSFYPMMMCPGQNISMPMMPTTQGGDKNSQQQFIYMMPVCFCDPSKMPKDMKMNNMQFPFFPYSMGFPQNTSENK